MFNISYSNEIGTNWYRVRLFQIDQVILVHRDVLVRELNMNPRCEIGCKEVTIDRIVVLGFGPSIESLLLSQVKRSGTY